MGEGSKTTGNQCFGSLMGRVDRQLTDAIEAATGERIVAFGRAGKSPENPFCGDFLEGSRRARTAPRTPIFRNGFLSRLA